LAKAFGCADYRGLLLTGRVLAAFFDVATLLFLALAAARLGGPSRGLWLAWIYAFLGLSLQQARFATPDTLALAAVAFTLWAGLRPLSWSSPWLLGLGVGLAAATRPNLATLALPVALALALLPFPCRGRRPWLSRTLALGLAAAVALGVWKLLDPGFFASALSPWPNPRRLASFAELAALLRGEGQFPPNLQWVGRGPFFLLWNLLFWGTGPALGLALLAATAPVVRRALAGDRRVWVLVSWPLPVFLFQATHLVVSLRHALPAIPFLLLLLVVGSRFWASWARAGIFALTFLWGLAWAAIPWQGYTREEASRFLREKLPPGAVLAVEAWDDPLPIGPGFDSFFYREIPAYEADTPEKRQKLLAILQEADAIVLSSQRAVGSICRVPDAYPLMSEWYHLLFRGQLGFSLAFAREVKLGGIFSSLAAEEALSVYDHPPVWVFLKDKGFSLAQVAPLLERVPLPENPFWETRNLEARGLPPYLLHETPLPPPSPTWPSTWWGQALSLAGWCLFLEMAGLAGAWALFRFLAAPLPLATLLGRTVGLLLVGMGVLWAGSLGLPGWRGLLPGLGLGVISLVCRPLWPLLVWGKEARFARWVFFLPFALFLLLRAFNPEIYWGEKPMDAAIFQLLLRTPSLPPQDPWFAGYPIRYYFFAFLPHMAAAAFSHSPASVAFNLATATVPALTCGAAAAVGWLVSRRPAGALLAAFLTQISGTAYLLVHPGQLSTPNFQSFWASSRVIPEAINEYPFWTALFADLHAHFLSFPGFCTALAFLLLAAQGHRHRLWPWAMGGLLAIQFMSNTWEAPALLFLTLVTAVTSYRRRGAFTWVLAQGAMGWVIGALPFLLDQGPVKANFFWEKGSPLQPSQAFALYGVHGLVFLLGLFLAFPHLASRGLRVFLLAAAAWTALAIFGPAHLTLVDKMNTYFKLGLQAFLILGSLGGGLLAVKGERLRRPWRPLAWSLAGCLLLAGLGQSLWAAWAVVHTQRVAGPRPTLDGEAYLGGALPSLEAALAALRALPARAVAEQAFPPYADTLRVPMFTGLPALVGWEYHLWQRGKSWAEIRLRAADLARLLQVPAHPLAPALLRRWPVDLLAHWEKALQPPGFIPWPGASPHLWVRKQLSDLPQAAFPLLPSHPAP
jgi:uncharacterized membrane protein